MSANRNRIQYQTALIENQTEVASEIFLLSIECSQIASISRPGQFVMVKPHFKGRVLLARPFSILKREEKKIYLLYKVCGKGTQDLSRLKKGDLLDLLGPLGSGFKDTEAKEWFLIAGGMGIAPLLFLAREKKNKADLTLFFGIKNKNQMILENEFKKTGCKIIIATEDGSLGEKGLVTDIFEKRFKKRSINQKAEIFTCGPRSMEKRVAQIALKNKIPCQISFEEYMACGLGTCMGCVVKRKNGHDWSYDRVCKEGPVFMADEMVWED